LSEKFKIFKLSQVFINSYGNRSVTLFSEKLSSSR